MLNLGHLYTKSIILHPITKHQDSVGAWLTLGEDDYGHGQPRLGGTQGVNYIINVASVLLTDEELSSLGQ